MAYGNEWDEQEPAGSAPANTIDTIIQQLKTDIRQRLEGTAGDGPLPDFGKASGNEVDPLRIVVYSGTTRPTLPNTGELFFDTDDEALEIWTGSDWFGLSGGSGGVSGSDSILVDVLANRPSAGSVSEGTLFWALDVEQLFIKSSNTWVNVNVQVFPASRLIEVSNESVAAINSSAGIHELSMPPNYGADANIVSALRVRAREATGPGDWTNWFYLGSWLPFDDGSTLAVPGREFIPNTTAYIAGVLLKADGAGVYTAEVWIVNDGATGISVDLQAQVVLSPIPSDQHLEHDPTFTL